MNAYERGLRNMSNPAVVAVVCTFLTLYVASPSTHNPVRTSVAVQFTFVSLIAALSAAQNSTISVILLMTFFCLVGQNNPEKS